MDLEGSALVLEGGGFRGVYTSGVLSFLMEEGIRFPYVVGVSMGACNAANYVSWQPERNRIVNIRYVRDPRYMSYVRLFTRGELFGMKFIFDTIPNRLVPFDLNAFRESDQKCVLAVTDCITGEPVYYEKEEMGDDYLTLLQASISLPFLTKPVFFRGRTLMDGGLADSVPIRKSMEDGNIRHVVVLTRPKGYRKKRSRLSALTRLRYPRYAGLHRTLENRHRRYNETMDFIDRLEGEGKLFSIRPRQPLRAARIDRNPERLRGVYDLGYSDARSCHGALQTYLNPD